MSATKKVLMIIAHQDFRDEEYSKPRTILEKAEFEITVASSSLDTCRGTLGSKVKPKMLLSNVDVANFDCIIFVGGAGASEYFNNPQALSIAKQTAASNKILAAICIAPAILANAGVIQQKRVTSFPSVKKDLQEHGAIYTGKGVEADGNIITANGPQSAQEFGRQILNALTK